LPGPCFERPLSTLPAGSYWDPRGATWHNVFGGDHSVATFLTYLVAAMLIAFVLPEP
jgi:hypothetical protein